MKKILSKIIPILQKLKQMLYIFLYNFLIKLRKINEYKILIASNRGNELTGNLKYIYSYLKKKKIGNVKIIASKKFNFLDNFLFILNSSNSKIIIIDDFFPLVYPLKIRKGTKLVQVWHAIGAFKTVGFSRVGKIGGPSKKSLTHKNYTDIIVSSESVINNYMEAFCADKSKIHAIGTPRTDMFFDDKEKSKIIKNIYQEYKILKNKKVILFAPTFRGNGKKSAFYSDKFLDIKKIYDNLDENEVFIIKMHPFVKERIQIKDKYCDKIIDLTDYNEINNLLLITDLLITDYSSVIFEYALLKRPVLFYIPDINDYIDTRDFYYDFDEYTYGTCCYNLDDLIANLKKPKLDKRKLTKFSKKFLNKCDGHATERFVNKIILDKEV